MTLYRAAALLILTIGSACHAEDAPAWTPSRIVGIDYPLLAVQSRTHGPVEIECILAGDGSVSSAKIRSGSTLLGRAVLDRLSEWRFRATSASALQQPAVVTLTFMFRLEEQAVSAPKTKFVYEYPYTVTVTSQPMLRSH
jgi:TonB family protein